MSCGVDCRYGSDPTLLWLWCRLVATALIRPLAWEPPYAMDVALEKRKKRRISINSLPDESGDEFGIMDTITVDKGSSKADSQTCQGHTQGLHFWRQEDQ